MRIIHSGFKPGRYIWFGKNGKYFDQKIILKQVYYVQN